MKIICAKDYSDLSRKAANIISAQVILKPESVLGLATGSSPLGVYRQLILWYEKGDLDFAEATSVNLDEYRGLSANNSCIRTSSTTSILLPTISIFPMAWLRIRMRSAAGTTV